MSLIFGCLHLVGFRHADSTGRPLRFSMNRFAIISDRGDPIGVFSISLYRSFFVNKVLILHLVSNLPFDLS